MKREFVLNADQLRKSASKVFDLLESERPRSRRPEGLRPRRGDAFHAWRAKSKRNEIYIVLDNVLDTYNIGSIFRLADAVAAKKIYLCGSTETPPNHRIKKASINTTEWVEWEYAETAVRVVREIREKVKDIQIVAIEQSSKSIPYDKFEYKLPICLVVGHETNGVSKEVLKMADAVVELPMFGVNKSLNVMVSLGIVLYEILEKTDQV